MRTKTMCKAAFLLSLLSLLPTLLAAAGIESSRHLKVEKGLLLPDEEPRRLLLLDFADGARWDEVINHDDRLEAGYGERSGRRGFFLAGPAAPSGTAPKRIDTAWQLWTAKFPVRGMTEVVGTVDLYSKRPLRGNFAPFRDRYVSALHWFAADGGSLGRTAFLLAAPKRGENPVSFRVAVPEGAVEGRLSLGADSPDLAADDLLLITRVAAGGIPAENRRFFTDAEAVLPPVRFVPGKVLCTVSAETPAGSSVVAETAFAADRGGAPAEFSAFGAAERPAPEGTGWVKCRIRFRTEGKLRPALRSVTLCGTTISGWRSLAERPAVIRRLSPSPAADPKQPFVFSIRHGAPLNWRTLRVVLDGGDVTAKLTRQELPPAPPEMAAAAFSYLPERPFAMRQVHKAVISLADIYGRSFSKTLYFFFDEPLTAGVVTLRDDGLLLADGKPFFPIGACYVKPLPENGRSLDNAFAQLGKAGFNLITAEPIRKSGGNYSRNYRAYLDKVAGSGIRVILAPGVSANVQDIDAILRFVAEYYRHPALLAWYIGDDTVLHNTPEQLERKYEAIRAVDPYHPTCQADAVHPYHPPVFTPVAAADDMSRYRPVVNFSEIFRAELYPVRDRSEKNARECVPSLIAGMKIIRRDIRDRATAPKSVWGIIQYFEGWSATVEKSTWKRYPTWQELRAMTWAAVIHGAKGLNWYSYHYYTKTFAHGFMYREETRRNMLRMVGEIVPLVDVLTERDNLPIPAVALLSGPAKDALGNDSISVMARKHKDHLYLFALNSAHRPVRARISVPDDADEGTVLYEGNRTITVREGTVTDAFLPGEVHIYKLKLRKR